ncbi:MAG: PHB depolymerase family esterase, partial [Planctomycetota bacterium]|nr:PHB depolymerase family esterase [Planctomycetota bacterium]
MRKSLCLLSIALPAAHGHAQAINDDCVDAIAIAFGTTGFSTLDATDDGPALPSDCDEGFGTGFGSDIWYTITPDRTDGIIVSTCDSANYDTRLAVYTGCGGTLIACNDDGAGCGGFTSRVSFGGVAGETYLLRVGGFDGERGSGTIGVEYGDGPPESPNIEFPHDGLVRQYRLHVPAGLPESAPLVLVLHGYSGNNNDMADNYGWREVADEEGFAVAFPNGTRDQWNNRFWDVDYAFHPQFDIDDDGFLSSLAVHLQDTRALDPERTFVTGFSNGAEMCFQLACRESETFRGFAPVVGMMLDPLFTSCDPTTPRPLLAVNGTADDVTLYEGDMGNTGGWGAYRSIPETIALWADLLDTPERESRFLKDIDPTDGSSVRLDIYRGEDH